MEAVGPIRPIIVRRGALQQQQPSSAWTSFAPSWIQNGIQTLKQTVFGPSNAPSEHENLDSLLGKRSEPADGRDPGPTRKRARRESPPAQAFRRRTDSMEPQPSRIQLQHSFPPETTRPVSPAPMPTLPRTQLASASASATASAHAATQSVRRSSPATVTGRVPGHTLGPALTQNYLTNLSAPRRQRLGALSGERRPPTATFASNNAPPPRAASQVGLGREYSFQGYRAVSSGPSSGTEPDRTSPSRQQPTGTRPRLASRPPSYGPVPVRTPKSGHVFGKGRSTSPVKPTLDRPAGTGWASGIVRTERERIRLGSFANIPYEQSNRPPIRDYTKLRLDPQVGIVAHAHGAPHIPTSNDAPHPTPASGPSNGPANRALNMLSEMSTPLSNARASPSLAPFTMLEIPPVQTRKVKVPIPASRAVAATKQREVKNTIAALRAKAQTGPYSTVHPPTTPSRKILSKRHEADNNEEDAFVVEPLKKGKENAKPTPSPGLGSSPGGAAAIASPVEERKEKEKEQEVGKEQTQEQTQETATATATAAATTVRASTPNIRTAGTLKFPTTSLAGGAPPSGIRAATSLRPTRETQFRTHAPAARIGGRYTANVDDDEDADEGAPTKEDLEKAAMNVPAINVPAGFKLSFGKDESSSTTPASRSASTPLALPTKHLVEAAVQASPAPEFKGHSAPISLSAPTIVFTAPTAAPSPQPTPAGMRTTTPPPRDEEMESGSPVKELPLASTVTPPMRTPTIRMPSFPAAPPSDGGDNSKSAPSERFSFPAIGSTGASKAAGFNFAAPPAAPAATPKAETPAPSSGSTTSTGGGFKFNLPTPATATAEPSKSAFPFGVTTTPVPTPTEPKPGSTLFHFGAPPQGARAAAPSTSAPAATPAPDKRPGFLFIAPASTTPAETPSKPPSLFSATPGTVTPTNKPFSFNAPSSAAPSEAGSSPIKADPVPGFPFAFGALPGSHPSPDSRASTPAAPATGGFNFTLPGVTAVQPINNPFAAKSGSATSATSSGFSFTNPTATAATPAKPFAFSAVPSTTPAGPPPSSSAPFQFGAPSSATAPAASTASFGSFGAGNGVVKRPTLQLDIDMDKDGATPPRERTSSNAPFAFGAPPVASTGGFGSAPPTAHPFGQTAPSSPFTAPRSETPFGAAPSTQAPFGQPPAVAGTGTGIGTSTSTGGFAFGAPASSASTPVTSTFPNIRAQTGSPAVSPFNPPAQLFGAPASGTPTSFPSNLSETGSDVGERRIKPLPKSRKTRTQSETRNALAKFHHHQ